MLNRLKELKPNYCLILACVYMIKVLVVAVSMADAAVMIGLLALYGYKEFLVSNRTESKVKAELEKLVADKYKLNKEVADELKQVKTDFSKISLAQQAKAAQKSNRLF